LDEEEDDIFAYDYGTDFPEALTVISAAITGGRPLNRSLGPLQILKIIAAAGEYRAPTPRRPGKGKPLPRVDAEKDMENEARMSAQKACQRLIVPKVKSESADAFIRRLDAHRSAPEALISPLAAPETEILFVKRMVAVKATYETPNVLILPRHARETEAEFEERLALCKKTPCLVVFPRGDAENGVQFRTRMGHQARARRPILPKAAGEPEKGFAERCKLQLSCERVIHPFDPKREDVPGYFRRLSAHKERYGLSFEPGDKKALDAALGLEKKPLAAGIVDVSDPPESAAALMKKAEAEAEKRRVEEAVKSKALEEKDRLAKETEEAEKLDAERVEQRIADMKQKAKEAQEAQEVQLMRKKSFDLEQININLIGFMPLKKLLMERGVPKELVFSAANKFALQEVAKKWADELKIEWVTE